MGEKDISEKILEDYDDVFADIVNTLLFGGRQRVRETELLSLKDRSQYKADGKLHEQERDAVKLWRECEIRLAVFGIENQMTVDKDMVFRVLGYDGSSYRKQLLKTKEKGAEHERYPVITLVLYFGYENHWGIRTLHDSLSISEELKPYVSDYRINVFEIAWLTEKQVKLFRSDFKFVADYFVQMRKNNHYIPSEETILHVDEVLKMMAVLTGDKMFEDVQNRVLQRNRKEEVTNMRPFLQDAWEEGMEKGMEKGMTERLIRQTYKKMLRGQEPTRIAEALEEEETVIREIYDIIDRNLPEFDSEKVYQSLQKEKAMVQ